MNDQNKFRVSKTLTPWKRIALILAGLLTGWHVFASFLWISPPSELRSVVPGTVLSDYMIPWYGQSWSVFAPAPINGDYTLIVRAIVKDGVDDDGEATFQATEWVDATATELSMSRYNLFPPRAAMLSTQQASKLMDSWRNLDDEQKDVVSLGFYEGDDWLGRMQKSLNATDSDNTDKVTKYILQERYTTAYATQVAQAVWGEENVVSVQFQVSRQNVVSFADRKDPAAERPAPQVVSTGWRGLIVMPNQSQEDFARVFLNSYEGTAE